MDLNEVNKYLQVGYGYIEISREYLSEYKGLCRRVFLHKNEIQVDFTDENYEYDNEETFYFSYSDLDEVIKNAEQYLKKSINQWENYNIRPDEFYFERCENLNDSWEKFFRDFYDRKMYFPGNYKKFLIKTIYSTALFLGVVSPDDNPDSVEKKIDINRDLLNSTYEFDKY